MLTARRKFCVCERGKGEWEEREAVYFELLPLLARFFPFITVYLWLGACIAQAEKSRTAFDVFPISLSTQRERKRRLNLEDLLNNIELEIISKLKWEWKLELIPLTPTSPLSFQFVEYALNHLLMKETTTTTTCSALPHGMCRSTVH